MGDMGEGGDGERDRWGICVCGRGVCAICGICWVCGIVEMGYVYG